MAPLWDTGLANKPLVLVQVQVHYWTGLITNFRCNKSNKSSRSPLLDWTGLDFSPTLMGCDIWVASVCLGTGHLLSPETGPTIPGDAVLLKKWRLRPSPG